MSAHYGIASPTGSSEIELKAPEMDELENMNIGVDESNRLAEREDDVLPELIEFSHLRSGHKKHHRIRIGKPSPSPSPKPPPAFPPKGDPRYTKGHRDRVGKYRD